MGPSRKLEIPWEILKAKMGTIKDRNTKVQQKQMRVRKAARIHRIIY